MTPAETINEALKTLRSPNTTTTTTTASLARLRGPVTKWLDSWTGFDLREDAALPEDALAVARAILGSADA